MTAAIVVQLLVGVASTVAAFYAARAGARSAADQTRSELLIWAAENVSKGDPDRLAEQAMGLLADVMDSPEATEEQARQAGIIGMAAASSLEDDISVADMSDDEDPEAVGGGQA